MTMADALAEMRAAADAVPPRSVPTDPYSAHQSAPLTREAQS